MITKVTKITKEGLENYVDGLVPAGGAALRAVAGVRVG